MDTPSEGALKDLFYAVSVERNARTRSEPEWKTLENVLTHHAKDGYLLITASDLDQSLTEGARTIARLDGKEYPCEVVGLGLGEISLLVKTGADVHVSSCSIRVPVEDYLTTLFDFLEDCKKSLARETMPTSAMLVADAVANDMDSRGDASHRVSYLMGAPGSGKTTRLIDKALSHASAGRRVIVVAYTNAAADVIFSRLADQVASRSDVTACRLGTTGASLATAARHRSSLVEATAQITEASEFDIVVTTAYRALAWASRSVATHSVVLIDEASTMPMPLAWVAALLAQDSVELYGDPFQLGPIAVSDAEPNTHARRWFGTSPFEIPGVMKSALDPQSPMVLREQHRLPPDLDRGATPPLYSRGAADQKPIMRESRSPWGTGSLLYVDTTHLEATCQRVSGSRINGVHADLVVECARALLEQGNVTPENAHENLLVVTPYRAQRMLIAQRLEETKWFPPTQIVKVVTTIHRAQGSERQYVLVDITDAPPPDRSDHGSIGRLWAGKGWQAPGARLLTTALTRATNQALVVMNRAVAGTPKDPNSDDVRALPRLNAILSQWGKPADLDVTPPNSTQSLTL